MQLRALPSSMGPASHFACPPKPSTTKLPASPPACSPVLLLFSFLPVESSVKSPELTLVGMLFTREAKHCGHSTYHFCPVSGYGCKIRLNCDKRNQPISMLLHIVHFHPGSPRGPYRPHSMHTIAFDEYQYLCCDGPEPRLSEPAINATTKPVSCHLG